MDVGDLLLTALTSSVVVVAVVGVAAFMLRTTFAKWLQHELNIRLEQYKAARTQDAERLKSELSAQNNRIEALQRGALSGMEARRTALDRRRLEAAERVWSFVASIHSIETTVLETFARLRLDKIASAAKDSGVRDWFGVIIDNSGYKDLPPAHTIMKEQPFVSPIVWAMFYAYRAVVLSALIPFHAIRHGIDPKEMIDTKHIHELITTALPKVTPAFLEQWGTSAYPLVAKMLREQLLKELLESLDSPQSDQQSLEKAADIVARAAKLSDPSSSAIPPLLAKDAMMPAAELDTGGPPR